MFAHQPSMSTTVAGGQGISPIAVVALGLCTIALLSFGSALSSVLFRTVGQCSAVEVPQQSVGPSSGEDLVGPTGGLGPGLRICEASSIEGD
jgi:hypothetical protein